MESDISDKWTERISFNSCWEDKYRRFYPFQGYTFDHCKQFAFYREAFVIIDFLKLYEGIKWYTKHWETVA